MVLFVVLFGIGQIGLWSASGFSDSGFTSSFEVEWTFWIAALAMAVALMLIGRAHKLDKAYFVLTLMVFVAVPGISNLYELRDEQSTPLPSDRAGMYVKEAYPEISGSDIFVMGTDKALTEASIFQMDKREKIDYRLFSRGSVVAADSLSDNISLIVTWDGIAVQGQFSEVLKDDGYIIYRK